MSELKPQWIVDELNAITIKKIEWSKLLAELQEELEWSELYKRIQAWKQVISDLNTKELELKETGKQLMLSTGMKKFEAIGWTIVQLNKKPWKLVIWDDADVSEYEKTKTTTTVDKALIKRDLKEWLKIKWVFIEDDYTLVIKQG